MLLQFSRDKCELQCSASSFIWVSVGTVQSLYTALWWILVHGVAAAGSTFYWLLFHNINNWNIWERETCPLFFNLLEKLFYVFIFLTENVFISYLFYFRILTNRKLRVLNYWHYNFLETLQKLSLIDWLLGKAITPIAHCLDVRGGVWESTNIDQRTWTSSYWQDLTSSCRMLISSAEKQRGTVQSLNMEDWVLTSIQWSQQEENPMIINLPGNVKISIS